MVYPLFFNSAYHFYHIEHFAELLTFDINFVEPPASQCTFAPIHLTLSHFSLSQSLHFSDFHLLTYQIQPKNWNSFKICGSIYSHL